MPWEVLHGIGGEIEGCIVLCVERDLAVEERLSNSLEATRDGLKSHWIPRFRFGRGIGDSEESVRVVEEVEGLMEVMENPGEDLVWEDVEVGGVR